MEPIIGIIGGKGRMGALFAKFFQDRGLRVLVSDFNTKLTNIELAQKSDIVLVSVPIDQTISVIESIIPHLQEDSALMDLTSVKVEPIKAMLRSKREVLGLHPMFGDSNPIPGQTIITCSTKTSAKYSQWLKKFFKQHQVKLLEMSAEEHDEIMATAQGLIHFADITFADALRRNDLPTREIFKYCSPASELKVMLAARLIDQDPNLYGNIQMANPHTLKTLKLYKKSVNDFYKTVKRNKLTKFTDLFQKNKDFFSNYTKTAYSESSYLIDKLLAKRHDEKPHKVKKPIKTDLAILGPKNTFTDKSAVSYLKNNHLTPYYANTIEEVFELVESGQLAAGVIPIENKLHGTVRETIDQLFIRQVHIEKSTKETIKHSLITLNSTKKNQIKRIISHPQALSQCKKYLAQHHLKAKLTTASSTAAAVAKLLKTNDKDTAVIASKLAAEDPRLKIIAENIADHKDNETKFVFIKKGPVPKDTTGNITSIAFHFDQDSPGSLFTVFKEFAKAKINMTKIESRPTKSSMGDYIFYLDFIGNLHDKKTQSVLKSLTKIVKKIKVLGCY